MTDTLTDEEKATFKRAADRRTAAGVRLKRITLMADENQVASFNELFDAWVRRVGKQRAVDGLLGLMSAAEARFQDRERANRTKGVRK